MDSLSHISLSISHGEQIGFIGASGSGKTTLAGILCGLMNMREGRMLVDGEPLTDSRRAAYIQRVGYVSQSSYIFNGPVAENVAFSQRGKPYDEERVLLPEYTASLISKEFTEQQGNRLGTTCCPSGTICISN